MLPAGFKSLTTDGWRQYPTSIGLGNISCGETTRTKASPDSARARCQCLMAAINSCSTFCNIVYSSSSANYKCNSNRISDAIWIASQMQLESHLRCNLNQIQEVCIWAESLKYAIQVTSKCNPRLRLALTDGRKRVWKSSLASSTCRLFSDHLKTDKNRSRFSGTFNCAENTDM